MEDLCSLGAGVCFLMLTFNTGHMLIHSRCKTENVYSWCTAWRMLLCRIDQMRLQWRPALQRRSCLRYKEIFINYCVMVSWSYWLVAECQEGGIWYEPRRRRNKKRGDDETNAELWAVTASFGDTTLSLRDELSSLEFRMDPHPFSRLSATAGTADTVYC